MKSKHILYTWDYHHGQATRVLLGGIPYMYGETMLDKQTYFEKNLDYVRTSLMREPRGHKNMLGAVITDPVRQECDLGMIFLTPHGYLEMCGDSLFSGVTAVVESGMFPSSQPKSEFELSIDTVAGLITVHVNMKDEAVTSIKFQNVASYFLGEDFIHVPEFGEIEVLLGYGGLSYAFIKSTSVGIPSLMDIDHETLLDIGTMLWRLTRERIILPANLGNAHSSESHPVDLVTIWEPLKGSRGSRVANFYAPRTCGRTPSGTGLSARVAIEVAEGRIAIGDSYIHESMQGIQFVGCPHKIIGTPMDNDRQGCIPTITARSFLMGVSQWVIQADDPFKHGFEW